MGLASWKGTTPRVPLAKEGAPRHTHPAGQPLCPPALCQHPAPRQNSPWAPQLPSPDTWKERQPESKHSVTIKVNKWFRGWKVSRLCTRKTPHTSLPLQGSTPRSTTHTGTQLMLGGHREQAQTLSPTVQLPQAPGEALTETAVVSDPVHPSQGPAESGRFHFPTVLYHF